MSERQAKTRLNTIMTTDPTKSTSSDSSSGQNRQSTNAASKKWVSRRNAISCPPEDWLSPTSRHQLEMDFISDATTGQAHAGASQDDMRLKKLSSKIDKGESGVCGTGK